MTVGSIGINGTADRWYSGNNRRLTNRVLTCYMQNNGDNSGLNASQVNSDGWVTSIPNGT